MNIKEMHSWFDVLQDKGDSPYFTVAEKTQFLNRAQMKFVNEVIQNHFNITGAAPEGSAIPYNSSESIQSGEEALSPIITDLASSDAYRKGLYPDGPTDSQLQYTPTVNRHGQFTQLQLDIYAQAMQRDAHYETGQYSTWEKTRVMHVINLRFNNHRNSNVRYMRKTDVNKNYGNSFKKPTTEDPVFFILRSSRRGGSYS